MKRTFGIIAIILALVINTQAQNMKGFDVSYNSKNIEFGIPADADSSDDFIIIRDAYCLSYNDVYGVPNWVSWNLNRDQLGGVGRQSGFKVDTLLPTTYNRIKHGDYTHSGYSRGHICMSKQRSADIRDNKATYFTTNILPQKQKMNNGPWKGLELYCCEQAALKAKEILLSVRHL